MANNEFEKAVLDNACGVREDAQVPEDIQKILKSNQNLEEVFPGLSENDKFFAAVILACASLIDPKEKGCEQCTEHIGHADAARKLMVDAPAVDAVEVVRCKDCVKSHKSNRDSKLGLSFCDKWHNIMRDNDFCSYGEAKGEPEAER